MEIQSKLKQVFVGLLAYGAVVSITSYVLLNFGSSAPHPYGIAYATTPVAESSANYNRTVERAERAVFLIKNLSGKSGGTGWLTLFNGKPVIVTNQHICTEEPVWFISQASTKTKYVANVVYTSAFQDVCILQVPKSFSIKTHPPLKIVNKNVEVFEKIWSLGYPNLQGPHLYQGYLVSREVVPRLSINKKLRQTAGKASFIAEPGQSGSPILDSGGRVVGMISRAFGADGFKALFLYSKDILRVFKESKQ